MVTTVTRPEICSLQKEEKKEKKRKREMHHFEVLIS